MSREHHERPGHGKSTLTGAASSHDIAPGKRMRTDGVTHGAHGHGAHDPDADHSEPGATISVALVAGKPARAVQPPIPAKAKGAEESREREDDAPTAQAARALTIDEATRQYAPLVYLAQGEANRPANASEYIKNSRLRWSHDSGRGDDPIADSGEVDERKLGSGGYSHRTKGLVGGHTGDPIRSNANVRPKDGEGDGGNEGFFLDLDNDHRASQRAGTDAPVYFEAVDRHYITYWFFYAFNDGPTQGKADGVDDHEGDWERICVRLNAQNRATEVAYYQHDGPPKTMPYSQAPRSGTHPKVFSAKGSHASYESAGAKPLYHKVAGKQVRIGTDHASQGAAWHTEQHLLDAHDQGWYGYGGAWGEVGATKHTTGPSGPSRFKKPAPDGW